MARDLTVLSYLKTAIKRKESMSEMTPEQLIETKQVLDELNQEFAKAFAENGKKILEYKEKELENLRKQFGV